MAAVTQGWVSHRVSLVAMTKHFSLFFLIYHTFLDVLLIRNDIQNINAFYNRISNLHKQNKKKKTPRTPAWRGKYIKMMDMTAVYTTACLNS